MLRLLPLLLLIAVARGQDTAPPTDPLSALRRTADKTQADWEALAKGLEPKIATMLPCDPKYKAAVEEVSHASELRLTALSTYLKAAAAEAKADTDAAKNVLAAEAAAAGAWNTERTEADQEREAIEKQAVELKESMRKRASLADAKQVLVEIANTVKQRSGKADALAGRRDTINALLGDLVTAYQARQTALEKEATALEAEKQRWSGYYSARLARAVMECAIINAPARKK